MAFEALAHALLDWGTQPVLHHEHPHMHMQALQYTYQPGRKLLQCTTQAQCVARCPAGNNPIYIAPQV